MTKYRSINDGSINYLQYEREYRFAYLFKRKQWVYIEKPFFHCIWGRDWVYTSDLYISELYCNLEKFVSDYPDISDYWKKYEVEQQRLIDKCKQASDAKEKRKGVTKYF
jgi:hypothetical protein